MTSITTTWLDYREVYPTHHVSGNLKVLHQLWSPQLRNARDILLWLPPSYQRSRRHYPVIYMQDAQNLFDPATSFGGQTWHVGETMTALGREGIEAIVVGIPHMGEQRIVEYNPFPSRHPGRGEQYIEFLLETLKPLVDRDFRTLPMRERTGIVGSSMGALIGLYAFLHPSHGFGFVGALSPAFWFSRGAIYDYVEGARFVEGKIYLDNGSRENSAWSMYMLLRDKGYQRGSELFYIRERGAGHHESAWARRLPKALRWLLRQGG